MKPTTTWFANVISAAIFIAPYAKAADQVFEPRAEGAASPHARFEAVVDDREIQRKILQEGVRLIAQGKTVPRTKLQLQLARRICSLKLPKPRSSKASQKMIAARSRSAVVVVARLHQGREPDDWLAVPATGFFIAESGVLVTSRHVVSGADYEAIVVMTGDARVVPVTQVLAADEGHDVILLQAEITGVPALALQPLAEAGSAVCVMSHPMGRFYTFAQGAVCRRIVQNEGNESRELLDISAEFGPGSSGAPVLDSRGNVVGWVDQLRVRSIGPSARTDGVRTDASPALVFRECGVASDILKLIRGKR